jgi:hypothetical protein
MVGTPVIARHRHGGRTGPPSQEAADRLDGALEW